MSCSLVCACPQFIDHDDNMPTGILGPQQPSDLTRLVDLAALLPSGPLPQRAAAAASAMGTPRGTPRAEETPRPISNWFKDLVLHPYFEPFIALTITVNCIELAWESPLDPPGTWKADFIASSEMPLLAIFTFEMFSKMIAHGLVRDHKSYFYDAWSCLDFVVVCTAWLPYVYAEAGNFTALRSVRALRPLRTLQYVPGMPVLVTTILCAVGQLGSVLSILGFVTIIFGILGEGMFEGVLHYHCVPYPTHRRLLEESKLLGMPYGTTPSAYGENATATSWSPPSFGADDWRRAAAAPWQEQAAEYTKEAEAEDEAEAEEEGEEEEGWLVSEAEAEARRAGRRSGGPGRELKGGSGGRGHGGHKALKPPPPPAIPPSYPPMPSRPPPSPPLPRFPPITADEFVAATIPADCPTGHRRRGRQLKGGGGGGGGGASDDPCVFDLHSAPLCNSMDPDTCSALGMADGVCVYFPEQTTLNDFDSVMNAMVAILMITTLDTWSASMYEVMQTFSPQGVCPLPPPHPPKHLALPHPTPWCGADRRALSPALSLASSYSIPGCVLRCQLGSTLCRASASAPSSSST